MYDYSIGRSSWGGYCDRSSSYPLFTYDGNSLDPCFVWDISSVINLILGTFVTFELISLVYFGNSGLRRIRFLFGSVLEGSAQKCRLVLIVFYFTFQGILSFAYIGQISNVLVLPAVFMLHLVEPTRSLVQLTSLLWIWTVQALLNTISLVQDEFSPVKVVGTSNTFQSIELITWLISILLFILEVFVWEPTTGLLDYYRLNGWDNDIDTARNSFSNIAFTWLQPLLKGVYYTDVASPEIIPKPPTEITIGFTESKIETAWNNAVLEARRRQPRSDDELSISLLSCIFKAFWSIILSSFILDVIGVTLTFAEPFLQQQFILFFTKSNDTTSTSPPMIKGYAIAGAFFVVSMVRTILNTQASQLKSKALYSATAIQSLIYKKALRLSAESRQSKSVGQIINHISLDIPIITSFPTGSAVKLVIAPFKVVLCVLALYLIIGNATWAGVTAALVIIPLVSKIKGITTPLTKQIMEYKDSRLQLINEVLNSILSVKLYTWEDLIEDRIKAVRNGKELNTIRLLSVWNSFSRFIFGTIPFFILCSSFGAFVLLNDTPLTPDIVFPALTLFSVLGRFISSTSGLIQKLSKAKVSYRRVEEFLLLPESNNIAKREYGDLNLRKTSINITNGTFLWNTPTEYNKVEDEVTGISNVALSDINLSTKPNLLTCIVGRVGSGKTTMIKSILGEMPCTPESSVKIYGSVAYCAQVPWIINASVQDNILFGLQYNKSLYERTIEVCELAVDILSFPQGDQTLVGEKGISLSGGQKARISLARAVYSRSDIYIFDDILSAIDRYVGQKIMNNILGPNGILSSKTRILATNSIPILHLADEIILLENARIVERKTGSDLVIIDDNSKLSTLVRDFGAHSETPEPTEFNDTLEADSLQVTLNSVFDSKSTIEEEGDGTKNRHLVSAEISSKGRVKSSVFFEYFKACNYATTVIYVAFTTISIFITVYQTIILTEWSELNQNAGKTIHPVYYLSLYALTVVVRGVFTMSGLIIIWVFSFIKGSIYFHDKMMFKILRSPMSLFETTPVGTILNRFSNDIAAMDLTIPGIFVNAVNLIVNSTTSFAAIIVKLPAMIVVIILLLGVYNSIRMYFIPASREIKRLSRTANSPIITHLLESVNGVDTLNAYDQQVRYSKLNSNKIDTFIGINYANSSLSRWLSIRLQTISSTILFCTCVFCVLTLDTKHPYNASLVGFILNYSLSIPSQLRSIITCWTQVETQTVAIERIIDYCDLPIEAPRIIDNYRPTTVPWPNDGNIIFKNYSTRYREDLPLVLKNLNLNIKGGSKVGIVGRTGSGKSTMTRAIFRLLEAQSGHIEIDDMNTSKMGLYDLRSNLSIIPQDCQTIEGTVRQNLDPLNERSDEDLWKVLEMSHLKNHVLGLRSRAPKVKKKKKGKSIDIDDNNEVNDPLLDNKPLGLDAFVFEGGSNFSGGQKQLLCLARALLNPSNILILDEATAAVDVETDMHIQKIIQESLRGKTILTIAHRIETVLNNDYILVLEHGEIKEFGTPKELQEKNGIFAKLLNS